jgi:signal transduction histidine kinase
MTLSYVEMLVKARSARETIAAWPNEGRRSTLAVEMLRSLWPGATLSACLLREEGNALDKTGRSRPEWVELIRESLKGGASEIALASVALNLGAHSLASEEIRFGNRLRGRLFLAIPEDAAPAAQMFLAYCAQSAAMRLEIEARDALAEESAGESRLADVGEASIPIAHEFNNFLNGLLLHTAVLKLQLPEETHDGLVEVRRQAMAAAALIQQFQHYRRRQESARLPIDLNQAVHSALETLGGEILRNSLSTRGDSGAPSMPCLPLPYGKINGSASIVFGSLLASGTSGSGPSIFS